MSGEGDGREVKCGFCARAAARVASDSGGVIKVISGDISHGMRTFTNRICEASQ